MALKLTITHLPCMIVKVKLNVYMKKETTIAIILGVITGVVMAILIILNSNKTSKPSNNMLQPSISPLVQFNTKKGSPLLITSPANKLISSSSSITITGSCAKNALLVFQSASFESAIKTDASSFSTPVTLKTGENKFKITQYVDKTIDSR